MAGTLSAKSGAGGDKRLVSWKQKVAEKQKPRTFTSVNRAQQLINQPLPAAAFNAALTIPSLRPLVFESKHLPQPFALKLAKQSLTPEELSELVKNNDIPGLLEILLQRKFVGSRVATTILQNYALSEPDQIKLVKKDLGDATEEFVLRYKWRTVKAGDVAASQCGAESRLQWLAEETLEVETVRFHLQNYHDFKMIKNLPVEFKVGILSDIFFRHPEFRETALTGEHPDFLMAATAVGVKRGDHEKLLEIMKQAPPGKSWVRAALFNLIDDPTCPQETRGVAWKWAEKWQPGCTGDAGLWEPQALCEVEDLKTCTGIELSFLVARCGEDVNRPMGGRPYQLLKLCDNPNLNEAQAHLVSRSLRNYHKRKGYHREVLDRFNKKWKNVPINCPTWQRYAPPETSHRIKQVDRSLRAEMVPVSGEGMSARRYATVLVEGLGDNELAWHLAFTLMGSHTQTPEKLCQAVKVALV